MEPPTAKATPSCPNGPPDWENHKSEIGNLYHQKTLEYIMHYMEQRHGFQATIKQWKSQLKKWGIKKRTEGDEYRAILKLKRKREDEQPYRASEFSLRGKVIPPAKITRYEAEALKKGLITEDDVFSQVVTPPDLLCWTPTFEGADSLSPDHMGSPSPSSRGTLQSQHYFQGRLDRNSVSSPFNKSPCTFYSAVFTRNLQSEVQGSMQLFPTSTIRTPPLRPFDWWWDFVDFNTPQSPAVLEGRSSNPFIRLLAPLGQKINNNEDNHIFRDLVIKSRQEFQCPGCRVRSIISSAIVKSLGENFQEPRKFESFVGAAIQKLNEWKELSDYQLSRPSFLVGGALRRLGRNAEALPLLAETLKYLEPRLSHNDLAHYRLEVALCHFGLNQIEDAVEQLRQTFGPEFGRLGILVPGCHFCQPPPFHFSMISKLMEYEEIYEGMLRTVTESDQIADVKIPAGTFCLEHEIISAPAIDETSTLYSTVFFSTIAVRRMDMGLLKKSWITY
ncbi:hypothetical protein N431DRAFT_469854 [Stipitochalara longipes BDJ]|nr:hypothetical protein N431DRAFT_469854 [Stipitochalara longipes BDJ]